jgi:hypothetical protein
MPTVLPVSSALTDTETGSADSPPPVTTGKGNVHPFSLLLRVKVSMNYSYPVVPELNDSSNDGFALSHAQADGEGMLTVFIGGVGV